ncbi:TetR/AcrR family transcriptional regulator [Ancylobacter sp. MQZ15Z-1]|uniref:TetR/AcrR family transcriptional regulator n=1 Tax=Ancylobacter mangrovi TaxID=2972472 RepID=A0A9X2PMC8_9HYPH|nr:TetR/AcrR family transcriptional regulator [Ancylobacter mangrovi]MCS0497792.1 TetR/AcrR family transcriptional regulator [Ancylobacter mangrovi]
MPLSKAHKAETRERILQKASELFRRDGIDGVSVPALMKEAGLTHGGFYAHFASKDELVAAIFERALDETSDYLDAAAKGAESPADAVIDAYVGAFHRDHPEQGCVVAALGSEAARGTPIVREALARGVRHAAERLGETLHLGEDREDEAIAFYSSLVGAMILSRACRDDASFSQHILDVCRADLKKRKAIS